MQIIFKTFFTVASEPILNYTSKDSIKKAYLADKEQTVIFGILKHKEAI